MKSIIIQGINCRIGTNASENWKLFDESKQTDIIFHLSSFPSCYVILDNKDYSFPEHDIISQAALQCKLNTKYKNLKNIKVDYTLCSNIEKGDVVGEIIYKSNRKVSNISV